MSNECCQNCRFSEIRKVMVNGEVQNDQECRRSPPRFFMNDDWSGTIWPNVKPSDWCGEHQFPLADHSS